MAFKKVVCKNSANFSEAISEASGLVGESGNVFVLFTGAIKAETGKSWCGDCTRAEPVIEKVMGETTNACLVECIVEREDYRDQQYVYRTDKKIQLACVPTIMNWKNPKIRLDDSQSSNEDLLRELMLEE
jgi:thiol-disulfide isomerase/thioredoxin